MSDETVLVTGGTGFVGRAVVAALAKRHIPVRAIVRTGTSDRLPQIGKLEVVETPDLFAEGSDWWAGRCCDVSRIVHLAWMATPGVYLTAPENLDCLKGTLSLAQGASAAGVAKIVGVGTCFEYDVDKRVLGSDAPLRPTTTYAACKVAAFQALSQWLPTQGVDFAWGRLFYLYGAGEHPARLVPYLHRTLAGGERADLTSGNQIRDFLDVEAGAEMLVDALLGDMQGAFNICSGVPTTVRQMAEQIAGKYDRADLLNFGARPDNLVDPPCVVGLPGQQFMERRA